MLRIKANIPLIRLGGIWPMILRNWETLKLREKKIKKSNG
jgi:hypothetical protein